METQKKNVFTKAPRGIRSSSVRPAMQHGHSSAAGESGAGVSANIMQLV